ncbi:hypothetical protein AU191_12690 [Mycolicibacterium acapulense]|nr:hypothetical protein AU191_12690 [Mycolicibacterium acapulense]
MDSPSGPCPQILVVIAQMPHQIRRLTVADRPVVGDARDAAECVVGFVGRGVHLADDRVFGPGHRGQ